MTFTPEDRAQIIAEARADDAFRRRPDVPYGLGRKGMQIAALLEELDEPAS